MLKTRIVMQDTFIAHAQAEDCDQFEMDSFSQLCQLVQKDAEFRSTSELLSYSIYLGYPLTQIRDSDYYKSP